MVSGVLWVVDGVWCVVDGAWCVVCGVCGVRGVWCVVCVVCGGCGVRCVVGVAEVQTCASCSCSRAISSSSLVAVSFSRSLGRQVGRGRWADAGRQVGRWASSTQRDG